MEREFVVVNAYHRSVKDVEKHRDNSFVQKN